MPPKVRVYAAAIKELAESDETVLLVMGRLAEEIKEQAVENARVIIPRVPDSFMDVDFGRDSRGLFFKIHNNEEDGKWSRYLANKEKREPGAWFETAVADVVGLENLRVAWFR